MIGWIPLIPCVQSYQDVVMRRRLADDSDVVDNDESRARCLLACLTHGAMLWRLGEDSWSIKVVDSSLEKTGSQRQAQHLLRLQLYLILALSHPGKQAVNLQRLWAEIDGWVESLETYLAVQTLNTEVLFVSNLHVKTGTRSGWTHSLKQDLTRDFTAFCSQDWALGKTPLLKMKIPFIEGKDVFKIHKKTFSEQMF